MSNGSNVFVPPVIEHAEWDDAEDRVNLFAITKPNPRAGQPVGYESDDDGPGDVEPDVIEQWYSMPGKPHPGLALAFLRMARMAGTEMAMAWLLEEAVGTEGFFALCAEPDIEPATMGAIMRRARDVVLGGLEGPKD